MRNGFAFDEFLRAVQADFIAFKFLVSYKILVFYVKLFYILHISTAINTCVRRCFDFPLLT